MKTRVCVIWFPGRSLESSFPNTILSLAHSPLNLGPTSEIVLGSAHEIQIAVRSAHGAQDCSWAGDPACAQPALRQQKGPRRAFMLSNNAALWNAAGSLSSHHVTQDRRRDRPSLPLDSSSCHTIQQTGFFKAPWMKACACKGNLIGFLYGLQQSNETLCKNGMIQVQHALE